MQPTHVEILNERHEGSGFILDVSIHESLVLPGVFLVQLTHTGHYNNDFHDIRVLFECSTTPGPGWTHASGVSMNLVPPSRFEVRADHIARAMTVEVRLSATHGTAFQVIEAWHGSVQLS